MSSPDFLKGYELANDSIRRFWSEFPVGRLATSIVEPLTNFEKGYVTVKAEVFRDFDDLVPSATGYAHGNVQTYLASMKRFYIEDTETSALSRAIKTLSPSTMRPSVEEMNRVDYLTVVPEMPNAQFEVQVSEQRDPWTFEAALQTVGEQLTSGAILDVPHCQHGAMAFKEGVGKTGTPYKGFVCTEKNRELQCPPRWKK